MIGVEYRGGLFYVSQQDFSILHSQGFGLKEEGEYLLSFYEACFLYEKKKLNVTNKAVSFRWFSSLKGFSLQEYLVFKELCKKGYVVKEGLKYGVTFRLYEKKKKQGHAPYLVDVLASRSSLKLSDLAAKVRVAHSTRKKLLLALVDNEHSITFVESNWANHQL